MIEILRIFTYDNCEGGLIGTPEKPTTKIQFKTMKEVERFREEVMKTKNIDHNCPITIYFEMKEIK